MSASPSAQRTDQFGQLKEHALANIERLFQYWKVEYVKIGDYEYDFIAPYRADNHYGAARFNIKKGLGADFTNLPFTQTDFSQIGRGFDRSDFGFSNSKTASFGFDIIGLCQRIHGIDSYKSAAKVLIKQLIKLDEIEPIEYAPSDAAKRRKEANEQQIKARTEYAERIFKNCSGYMGTLGEVYLKARAIDLKDEKNIYFHPNIMCSPAKRSFPALIFPVQKSPNGVTKGIHRIYLSDDGTKKAPIENPKMALGDIRGHAIWFGKPTDTLYISEGPENALSLRVVGAEFVACTINAGNFHMLDIPNYVKHIILCPDPDKAGEESAKKAAMAYHGRELDLLYPKRKKLPSGKWADLNDVLLFGSELSG